MTAYTQLLSVGLIWISFHCAGMCGPILMGLDVAGVARGHGAARGAGSVLLYQLGRASTYAVLGATAGLAGRGLGSIFQQAGGIVSLVFGLALIAYMLFHIFRRPPRTFTRLEQRDHPPGRRARFQAFIQRAVHKVALRDDAGPARLLALGALLGFLPCMITLWALGLAATTGSPVHGAGVMLLLVVMTTPVLLGVTLLPRVLARAVPRRWRTYAPQFMATISGVWLVLVGLAGLEVLAHQHVRVGAFLIMLW